MWDDSDDRDIGARRDVVGRCDLGLEQQEHVGYADRENQTEYQSQEVCLATVRTHEGAVVFGIFHDAGDVGFGCSDRRRGDFLKRGSSLLCHRGKGWLPIVHQPR